MTTVGLVLSGGGARGAYEAGLIAGIIDVLGVREQDAPPFQIYAGTSVGGINAAYLAAHADRGDLGIEGLIDIWQGLSLRRHLKLDTLRFFGLRDRLPFAREEGRMGRSLLDPKPIETIVRDSIPWDRLHHNAASEHLRGIVVTALHIASGRTHMFAELAPGWRYRPSLDPMRTAVCGPLGPDHVLASASLPLVFPSVAIDGAYFCDGGLRFNTPLSPAIRCGADKLVVVPLIRAEPVERMEREELYPSPFFLLGKLLNALILDPITYDLKVLERFNALATTLDETLDREEWQRVERVLLEARGAGYRRIDTLSFHPSADLGMAAGEFLAEQQPSTGGWIADLLLQRATALRDSYEADLVSFLLFDGRYAERLVSFGRADAEARADDIRAFFRR